MNEMANLVIDRKGRLMITTKDNIPYREVVGVTAPIDYNYCLELISDKNYNELLTFTYKYEIKY